MKVLVTGGCGFIGSHVVDAYIREAYQVVVVDNLSTGKRSNVNERAVVYVADVTGPGLDEIFEIEKPDIVNHLAAQISVPQSVKDPLFDAEVNIKGTLRLLELSQRHGVKKFIFSSTGGAIYGEATQVPTPEDYVPHPASPYAIAKFTAEHYIRFYSSQHGLNYTILRYSNVYGPRQIPHGEAGVVAIFTEGMLRGDLPTVNHFPGEPEGMIRDYCFVKDVAEANIIASASNSAGIHNVGTGRGTTTMQLYRMVLATLRERGIGLTERFDEPPRDRARGGDIRVSTLDVTRTGRELGFKAGTDLSSGLAQTVEWYLEQNRQA